jgi:V/A-type H+-transporting ATPase subunit D
MAPTKGNLILSKKSLELAKLGFDLLDRKRNILIREMMTLIDRAEEIQNKIDSIYKKAYLMLQKANITLGICKELALTVPIEDSINLSYKSIMGVEIPIISIEIKDDKRIPFGLYYTNSELDKAYLKFIEVKKLTIELAEVENSIYLLADAVKKIQKRANALKNIMIPKFETTVKFMANALEEKEREDFSRLKVIKRVKQKDNV